ncbi:MAG: WYL domain-containing protein [Caloramator sp.]|nr:MAG: WYL domain-containing protein [Caloramator sp.]
MSINIFIIIISIVKGMVNMEFKDSKSKRILYIYDKLLSGEAISKDMLANKFNVDKKTIQRDFEEINMYLSEKEEYRDMEIKYDSKLKKHKLVNYKSEVLNKKEIMVISKILLESRSLNKKEIKIIDKLLNGLEKKDKEHIEKIISNEKYSYFPVYHEQDIIDKIWELSKYISEGKMIEIEYIKMNETMVKRIVKPVSIIFSEYYFYLIAFFQENDFTEPIVFRIDRIISCMGTGERFKVPEIKRFQDGEFRKRVQFMYAGKLMKIKFEFWGPSIESVLDRLPTAKNY